MSRRRTLADSTDVLDREHLDQWSAQGFTVERGLIDVGLCDELQAAAVALSRRAAGDPDRLGLRIVDEGRPRPGASHPEDFIAKVFNVHRQDPFRRFVHDTRLLAAVGQLLGDDVDVFLSQYIFKAPNAYGQPWHQDSDYFRFVGPHQLGVWVATTRATVHNGCLWVVPGTHGDPIHRHVPDDRPNATTAYTRIVGVDTSSEIPVEMSPGDVLFFDSHLMHSSTDNESDELRASYVCHYATVGTVDPKPNAGRLTDWVPALRAGRPVVDG